MDTRHALAGRATSPWCGRSVPRPAARCGGAGHLKTWRHQRPEGTERLSREPVTSHLGKAAGWRAVTTADSGRRRHRSGVVRLQAGRPEAVQAPERRRVPGQGDHRDERAHGREGAPSPTSGGGAPRRPRRRRPRRENSRRASAAPRGPGQADAVGEDALLGDRDVEQESEHADQAARGAHRVWPGAQAGQLAVHPQRERQLDQSQSQEGAFSRDLSRGTAWPCAPKKLRRYSRVCTRPYQSRAAVTARGSSCHSSPRSCRVRCGG